MTLRHLASTLVTLTALSAPSALTFAQSAHQYGPPKGTLVIVGGGSTTGTNIMERFIALGGGADTGRFIVVPTAGGNRDASGAVRAYDSTRVLRSWRERGVKNVAMLHTHDTAVTNTEAFVKDLKNATAVWFDGGRQWNIVDSYAGTRTYAEFHKVLERGGVIGGTSAGASIQASYLVRGAPEGNSIMMAPGHEEGFGYLRDVAVDQHVVARNRLNDLPTVLARYPSLLGIGIDEGTAIVVRRDTAEVLGASKVFIYGSRDGTDDGKPYLTLAPGTRFDLKARKRVKNEE